MATLGAMADAATITFNDPTPTSSQVMVEAGDQFGWSVALDGNNVLIGAYADDTLGPSVGQAHLFDAVTGNLLRTFNNPTPSGRWFGSSVALDGNNVLIGASGSSTLGTRVGQAHLFDAATGNLLRTFDDPTPTTTDSFGTSVALDGNNVLIGADLDDTLGSSVGQAHLFDAVTGNLLWTLDDPTPTGGDSFGSSVVLDGNNVLIGAHGDNNIDDSVAEAHLFDATTGNLLWTFNDPNVTGVDVFGISVALDGNNFLIGDSGDDTLGSNVGQAYLFSMTVSANAIELSSFGQTYTQDFDGQGTNTLAGRPLSPNRTACCARCVGRDV